jgi:predicted signal transduction protein with EAL and GGDEF domain
LVGRIQESLRRSDTLARIGDAELGLLVPGLARPEQAAASARRIAELTRQPFGVEGLEVDLEVNIGVATYPQHGHDKHALVQHAEAAMLQARRTQQTVVVHDESPEAQDESESALRDNLRAAIEDNLLTVQFLPKLAVQTGRLVEVEALVRWEHPQHGLVATGRFLWLAEETGLIVPLTLRVLRLTLDQQRIWRSEGWDLAVAVNLATAVCRTRSSRTCSRARRAHRRRPGGAPGVRAHRKPLTRNPSRVLETLQRLAGQGCQLSLDDSARDRSRSPSCASCRFTSSRSTALSSSPCAAMRTRRRWCAQLSYWARASI